MPLKKLQFRPGVTRENTRYTSENGWYDCDKVRFRQGTPEKIGGWEPIGAYTYNGVCRSLNTWVTNDFTKLTGVGTNSKFYIEFGTVFYDVTPLRTTETLTDPFETTTGSTTVTVTDASGGFITGDFVTFSGATAVGGLTLNGEYELTFVDSQTYTIEAATAALTSATGGGTVTAAYQINVGAAAAVPYSGWGSSTWGSGTWGNSGTATQTIRIWNQANFGEDLIYGFRDGPIYYWDATGTVATRGVLLSSLSGASDVPVTQTFLLTSDTSRFVFAFGANDFGSSSRDPLLIRWSDQENAVNWTPAATNQAGSVRLSSGSEIVTALQSRQEILVWTDAALYSLQYQGAPIVWGSQLLGDNISICSPRSAAYANGVAYWMGKDKFYKYDGRVQTLRCDVRQFIFNNINMLQLDQVFSGTNEGFNEVWWFYCNGQSNSISRYVVYNYAEDVWYYGTMGRTAWLDSGLRDYPIAATYSNTLVNHESGNDSNENGSATAIEAYITSSEFDLDDGHQFAFIRRVLPDVTFRGSSASSPQITMELLPLTNSGSGYLDPESVGGTNSASVIRTATGGSGSRVASLQVEQFTGQVFTRVRGRQMAMQVYSDGLGVAWQLGSPRLDMRPDGRRG